MIINEIKKYTVLDLFCGCGGLLKGFEMAGYGILLGVDFNEPTLKTYAFLIENVLDMATLCKCEIRDEIVKCFTKMGYNVNNKILCSVDYGVPHKREETLDSIAFTLNYIWLQDHGAKKIPYPHLEEEERQMPMVAEGKQEKKDNSISPKK